MIQQAKLSLKLLHKNYFPEVIVQIIKTYLPENLDIVYTIDTKEALKKTLKDSHRLLEEKIKNIIKK